MWPFHKKTFGLGEFLHSNMPWNDPRSKQNMINHHYRFIGLHFCTVGPNSHSNWTAKEFQDAYYDVERKRMLGDIRKEKEKQKFFSKVKDRQAALIFLRAWYKDAKLTRKNYEEKQNG